MGSWELRYVKDTLDRADEAQFDFPLLVNASAAFSVIGLQPLQGSAGWFRANAPADPDRTDMEELDPEGRGWDPVDLTGLDIAPSVLGTVVGHTRTFADENAARGFSSAADGLRAMAAALAA